MIRIGGLLLLSLGAGAQTRPAFEVASIRLARQTPAEMLRAGVRPGATVDGAQATFRGMSLVGLICYAHHGRAYQVSAPEAANRDLFDIVAKLPEGSSKEQVPAMVETLLAERFHLVLRRETKQFPVYALIAGKNGPKLTPKPADYRRAPDSPLTPLTLDEYAAAIQLDRPVVNQTGIEGEHLFDLLAILRARMPASIAAAAGSEGADPMAAFQIVERLGLKLERRNVPMPYLVVERVEKPTED